MVAAESLAATKAVALEADGVYVSLDGMPVLRDVSARVRPGEAVAILGGNGSGKSTFVRAILGLVPHLEGSIKLFGTELSKFKEHSRIGYVPQHSQIGVPSATVRELVASGRLSHHRPFAWLSRADKQAISDALDLVELGDRASWPFGTLSGGQKQRVLIARALVTDPELLVMDEPLAGVDLHSQEGLADLMGRLVDEGLGLLVVLHEIGAMERVLDRSITLCDGRIVEGETTFGAGDVPVATEPHELGLEDPFPEVLP